MDELALYARWSMVGVSFTGTLRWDLAWDLAIESSLHFHSAT